MATVACEICEQPLDPRWKFCVHCGSPVPAAAHQAESSVPATIRSGGGEVGAMPKRQFDWQLGLGLLLALAGVAAIVYLVSALIAARA